MAAVTYADLYKPLKDFFTKNYSLSSARVEGKGKSSSGLTLTPSFEQKNDTYTTALEFEQSFSKVFNLSDATGKVNLASSGNLTAEFKLKNIDAVPGLEVTTGLTAGLNDSSKDTHNVSAVYKHGKWAATADGKGSSKSCSWEASLTHRCCAKYLFGANAKFEEATLLGYSLGGSVQFNDTIVAGTVDDKYNVKVGALYTAGPFGIGGEVNLASAPEVIVGSQTAINDVIVKARASNKGIIGLSAVQKINPGLTLTASADIDTTKGNTAKVGFKLAWE